ncbi:VacJ family lipoprotein [Patescibacteria group bacterium]|nr:VacJ family lipoprotein [Patescibacteria group bacterium]
MLLIKKEFISTNKTSIIVSQRLKVFSLFFLIHFLFFNIITVGECSSTEKQHKPESSLNTNIDFSVITPRNLPFPGKRMKYSNRSIILPDNTIIPTVVSYTDYRDPLIKFNRIMFSFNNIVYRVVLIPLSNAYIWITPNPLETGINNFFYNIKTPIYAVNHLLQFKPKPLGRTLLRFGINTTIGLLGFFDPAQKWFHINKDETYFENTLSQYGLGYGIYIVLPIIGPSDIRNSLSMLADNYLNPIPYLLDYPESFIVQTFDYFQDFAPKANQYSTLYQKSQEPYIFFRNLYLQGIERDAAE